MKVPQPQIFRRWMLGWVLIALLVSACAPAAPGAPAAPEQAGAPAGEAVTRANTLIFAADMTDIITLDPAVAYEFGGILPVGNMYETLLSFPPGETELQPVLAESWDVSQEGDMWKLTFQLNPNAKFASGAPVTAEDVVFSWSRAIDINKSPAFLLTDVCQMTKENIRAVDAGTVELKIPGEASPSVCLSVLTFTVAAVVEKAAVEPNMGDDMGESWLNDHSAGSGPYILDRWDRNVSVTLNANPNYWGGVTPAMKRVILQNMPEAVNRQAAIETGDADIIQDVSPEQVAVLEGNPDIQLVKALSTLLVYAAVNASMPPFDNPDARQALRYAVNYDNIITLLGGNGELVQEIIPIGFLGHTGKNPFQQDLEKAKELFAKAGVAEGTVIPFTVATGTAPGGVEWATIAASIQADLAQIGINLEIQQLQQSELLTKYRAQELPMLLMNWGPDFPDPDGNATPFANYEARSLAWRNSWNDPQAIELSKQAARETDPAKRVELYAQLVEYVQNNGPYVMLYQPTQIYAVRNNVEGFVYDPNDTPSISLWLISKQ
ncbi:ABC transporter substrate-binding protein [Caldilinea sp.]|uniref:ABC transporter substrate-binding protein n=1 Tax=Caldilinea sp. TaxID=2293560 RepID=UPI0021DE2001|nr:ABC transporter substrate-binding protein [Caldilinea sp.]GIV70331.1 MAG: ABC transporter substrate-binding protein [Caldilinea sp.]